jgi:hypothetical protein
MHDKMFDALNRHLGEETSNYFLEVLNDDSVDVSPPECRRYEHVFIPPAQDLAIHFFPQNRQSYGVCFLLYAAFEMQRRVGDGASYKLYVNHYYNFCWRFF